MIKKTEKIWHNGEFVAWDNAKIHVLSHGLHYGGGAFEGIRFYKTKNGPAIFRLNDHIDRLFYSASALKINIPYSKQEIIDAIIELVKINKLEEGYIRPITFFGYGKLGVNPIGNPIEFAIACWPWGAYLPHDNINVKVSSYIRIHPDSTVVDAKICGHYVNSILASLELQGTNYQEALFLDADGFITEGVGENFFIIKDKTIYTPNLGAILSGITRSTVINLAKELGYQVIETDINLYEAYQADEAFFTGTAAEVTAIKSINNKILGTAYPGEITAIIKKSYQDIVHGNNHDYFDYLTFI